MGTRENDAPDDDDLGIDPDAGDDNDDDERDDDGPDDGDDDGDEWKPPTREEWEKTQRALRKANKEAKKKRRPKDDDDERGKKSKRKRDDDDEDDDDERGKDASKRVKEAEQKVIRQAVKGELRGHGLAPKAAKRALKMIDVNDIDFDDDGDPDEDDIAAAIADLKEDFPELFRKPKGRDEDDDEDDEDERPARRRRSRPDLGNKSSSGGKAPSLEMQQALALQGNTRRARRG